MKTFISILKIFFRLKYEELIKTPLVWLKENFEYLLVSFFAIFSVIFGTLWLVIFIIVLGHHLSGDLSETHPICIWYAYGTPCLVLVVGGIWLIVSNWKKAVKEYRRTKK